MKALTRHPLFFPVLVVGLFAVGYMLTTAAPTPEDLLKEARSGVVAQLTFEVGIAGGAATNIRANTYPATYDAPTAAQTLSLTPKTLRFKPLTQAGYPTGECPTDGTECYGPQGSQCQYYFWLRDGRCVSDYTWPSGTPYCPELGTHWEGQRDHSNMPVCVRPTPPVPCPSGSPGYDYRIGMCAPNPNAPTPTPTPPPSSGQQNANEPDVEQPSGNHTVNLKLRINGTVLSKNIGTPIEITIGSSVRLANGQLRETTNTHIVPADGGRLDLDLTPFRNVPARDVHGDNVFTVSVTAAATDIVGGAVSDTKTASATKNVDSSGRVEVVFQPASFVNVARAHDGRELHREGFQMPRFARGG